MPVRDVLIVGAGPSGLATAIAAKQRNLDYVKQQASYTWYEVTGKDPVCGVAVTKPAESGQIWVAGGEILTFSSPSCSITGVKKFRAEGKKLGAVYLVDQALGIKMFADKAFFALGGKDPKKPEIAPFLLKTDAEAHAAKIGGNTGGSEEALAAAPGGK